MALGPSKHEYFPSSQSLRTPEEIQSDLLYLQENRVCETLEFIVKSLLRDQPEDPILSICNMLMVSNRGESRNNPLSNSTNNCAPAISDEPKQTLQSSVCTPVTEGSGRMFPLNSKPGATAVRTVGVSGSSRADTPASGMPGRLIDNQSLRLERDESSRSDGSAFSISSIDMSEFLSEFRAAHIALFGEGNNTYITIQDLADLVDRIAIPLPDVKLVVDLFNELRDFPPSDGSVSFEAFLARMNFKIQGRYPVDVIRGAFFMLLPTEVAAALNRPTSAVARGLPGIGSVGSNLEAFMMGSSGGDGSREGFENGGQNLFSSAPSAVVTLDRLSQVALWQGLGLRHDLKVLEGLLSPFKKGSDFILYFSDFLKIVQQLTGITQTRSNN